MSHDPITDAMTPEQRAEWLRLRAEGYAMLRQAHEIYLAAHKAMKDERK